MGWALPGAIPSLNHLLGTSFMPQPNGAILMLDIPEGKSIYEGLPIADVDAWITDLYNAGVLAKINGLIIGRPYKYTRNMVKQLKEVILRLTQEYNYPILFNVDFGHTDPMTTIPITYQVELNSDKSTLILKHKVST